MTIMTMIMMTIMTIMPIAGGLVSPTLTEVAFHSALKSTSLLEVMRRQEVGRREEQPADHICGGEWSRTVALKPDQAHSCQPARGRRVNYFVTDCDEARETVVENSSHIWNKIENGGYWIYPRSTRQDT